MAYECVCHAWGISDDETRVAALHRGQNRVHQNLGDVGIVQCVRRDGAGEVYIQQVVASREKHGQPQDHGRSDTPLPTMTDVIHIFLSILGW